MSHLSKLCIRKTNEFCMFVEQNGFGGEWVRRTNEMAFWTDRGLN